MTACDSFTAKIRMKSKDLSYLSSHFCLKCGHIDKFLVSYVYCFSKVLARNQLQKVGSDLKGTLIDEKSILKNLSNGII